MASDGSSEYGCLACTAGIRKTCFEDGQYGDLAFRHTPPDEPGFFVVQMGRGGGIQS